VPRHHARTALCELKSGLGNGVGGHESNGHFSIMVSATPRAAPVSPNTLGKFGLFKRTRPLSHRRIFEIFNPVWGRAADEFSDKGAPDIVLLNRAKTSCNQASKPSYIARRVSIACDNSRTKNCQALETYPLNRLFL
jgi:hypothetical protein